MNITVNVRYDNKLRLYKVDEGLWKPAWDVSNTKKYSEFGFNIVENRLFMVSEYHLINVQLDYPVPTTITLNNTGVFIDTNSNEFPSDLFVFTITYDDGKDENFSCTTIKGDLVDTFDFNEDGIIYGINSGDDNSLPASISYECCSSLGYTFDPETAICYWSTPCQTDDYAKIYINPEGNDGAIFEVNENEDCRLTVAFDWLVEYNCESLSTCVGDGDIVDTLSNLTVGVRLERMVPNETFGDVIPVGKRIAPFNMTTEMLYSENVFNGKDIIQYFTNENSGILANGYTCDLLKDKLELELMSLTDGSLNNLINSNWMHYEVEITDPSILELIKNQKIKFAIEIFGANCDMSLLVDNIKLNKVCDVREIKETIINSCPSFDLNRVIDNKKSWVSKNETEQRKFDLSRRETDYKINHHKLGINSKEVDLNVSAARAIETDVMNAILEYPCILSGDGVEVNLLELLTTDIFDGVFTVEQFNSIILSELIDAKDRQTIRSYPLLTVIYERYLNALEICGVETNAFTYEHMEYFISLIGNYWVELVEQVIPSTTIWGATYKYSNTIFHTDKYKYKKGSTFVCEPMDGQPIIGSDLTVDVVKTLTSVNENGKEIITTETCSGVFMSQIDDGSEFIGSVTIIGGDNFRPTVHKGDIIFLNEKLENIKLL